MVGHGDLQAHMVLEKELKALQEMVWLPGHGLSIYETSKHPQWCTSSNKVISTPVKPHLLIVPLPMSSWWPISLKPPQMFCVKSYYPFCICAVLPGSPWQQQTLHMLIIWFYAFSLFTSRGVREPSSGFTHDSNVMLPLRSDQDQGLQFSPVL